MEGSGDIRLPAKVQPSTWPPARTQEQRGGSLTRSSVRRPSPAAAAAHSSTTADAAPWWRCIQIGAIGWKWRGAALLALLVAVAILGLAAGILFAQKYLDAPVAV
ncbi:uncharacterized protein LOC142587181 [Dermacentor variabilis]|uniref:uncharacterized protein LOC142587181 n=1 Tax=Dermacentor variabilis TaxID=34621 RepID=UPI003F5C70B7